ncbi:hypothetical protein NB717_000069 [Xanthomonas sacchari]|uniref:hypothetical protein n=1 Tax=Xanthomonas sacchari TaxID=56458 RepID=UPI00225E0E47|nr:hypothetical protein [Xanthomonas sacchari]MCW0459001.1 hypothetical protein [Xanthomonas sacchari]
MDLPTAFGWVVLLLIGMLVKSLTSLRNGWVVIAAAMLVLSIATLGYGAGMAAARLQAMEVVGGVTKGCIPAYVAGTGAVISVRECLEAQSNARLGLIDIGLNTMIGLAALLSGLVSFGYLALRIQGELAELKRIAVALPQPANQQNQDRPEERDSRDG